MFKCSEGPASSGFWAGEPLSDMDFVCGCGGRLWRFECAVADDLDAAQGYFARQWVFKGGRSGERNRLSGGGLPFVCYGGNRMTDSRLQIRSGDRKAW